MSAIRDGRPLEPGRIDDGFQHHIHGAIGEYAVARALNVCWSPAVGRLDTESGDLPGNWHVKTTTRAKGSLIVRPHDPEAMIYALVVVQLPVAVFVGSISGLDARQPEYWRDVNLAAGIHRAAWFVPQRALNDPEKTTTSTPNRRGHGIR